MTGVAHGCASPDGTTSPGGTTSATGNGGSEMAAAGRIATRTSTVPRRHQRPDPPSTQSTPCPSNQPWQGRDALGRRAASCVRSPAETGAKACAAGSGHVAGAGPQGFLGARNQTGRPHCLLCRCCLGRCLPSGRRPCGSAQVTPLCRASGSPRGTPSNDLLVVGVGARHRVSSGRLPRLASDTGSGGPLAAELAVPGEPTSKPNRGLTCWMDP